MLARLPPDLRVIADAAYDSAELRRWLADRGSRVIIPNRKNRKQPYPFDAVTYRRRNIVERTFCRLKDFRRLATRYDRLDETFVSTLCIAAALAYFLKSSDSLALEQIALDWSRLRFQERVNLIANEALQRVSLTTVRRNLL